MGKDLRGKELGVGINQQKNGLYSARFDYFIEIKKKMIFCVIIHARDRLRAIWGSLLIKKRR